MRARLRAARVDPSRDPAHRPFEPCFCHSDPQRALRLWGLHPPSPPVPGLCRPVRLFANRLSARRQRERFFCSVVCLVRAWSEARGTAHRAKPPLCRRTSSSSQPAGVSRAFLANPPATTVADHAMTRAGRAGGWFHPRTAPGPRHDTRTHAPEDNLGSSPRVGVPGAGQLLPGIASCPGRWRWL